MRHITLIVIHLFDILCLCSAAPLAGMVEQEGARVAVGGDLRFYVVGSSTAAWQTWPDQLHGMLKKLGYKLRLPRTQIPGEITHPSKSPVCMDADTYDKLVTPRLGMVGWSSWGFAYESTEDCDESLFRSIAGHPVSCTNAWACNPKWTGGTSMVPLSTLAAGVSDADVVVLANWINDGKTAQVASARRSCYNSSMSDAMDTIDVTGFNLKRIIQAIHERNPAVVILVLARYPDTMQIVYQNQRTLASVTALNAAIQGVVRDEPNTYFVDLRFPSGEIMYQTMSKYHPNCRGDMIMATSLVEAMFENNVIAKGLELGDPNLCLNNRNCSDLTTSCCQRSALCYVGGDGQCTDYGPGHQ